MAIPFARLAGLMLASEEKVRKTGISQKTRANIEAAQIIAEFEGKEFDRLSVPLEKKPEEVKEPKKVKKIERLEGTVKGLAELSTFLAQEDTQALAKMEYMKPVERRKEIQKRHAFQSKVVSLLERMANDIESMKEEQTEPKTKPFKTKEAIKKAKSKPFIRKTLGAIGGRVKQSPDLMALLLLGAISAIIKIAKWWKDIGGWDGLYEIIITKSKEAIVEWWKNDGPTKLWEWVKNKAGDIWNLFMPFFDKLMNEYIPYLSDIVKLYIKKWGKDLKVWMAEKWMSFVINWNKSINETALPQLFKDILTIEKDSALYINVDEIKNDAQKEYEQDKLKVQQNKEKRAAEAKARQKSMTYTPNISRTRPSTEKNTGLRTMYEKTIYMSPISSSFGVRKNPTGTGQKMHRGVDFAVPLGTPIEAPLDGKVIRMWEPGPDGSGRGLVIQHSDGTETKYFHLDKILVKQGQTVQAGDIIAQSGNTGASTGPHLHFEVVQNGQHVNPMVWLENKEVIPEVNPSMTVSSGIEPGKGEPNYYDIKNSSTQIMYEEVQDNKYDDINRKIELLATVFEQTINNMNLRLNSIQTEESIGLKETIRKI